VPADSWNPPTFEHPLWQKCLPPTNCFQVLQEYPKGEEQKNLINKIRRSHHSKTGQLLIYCRSLGPNPMQTLPTWTVVCIAFKQGQEVGHHSTMLGQNTSAREAAFQAVADAATLAKDILVNSPSTSVTLLMADHFILPYCQITDHHDNAMTCRTICNTTATILDTYTSTSLSMLWL
jgi:hypothetical protein